MDTASPSIPNRRKDFLFACKVKVHQAFRIWRDVTQGIRHHAASSSEQYPHVWTTCRVPLWVETTEAELQLELGKVQNLRRACTRIDGAVVPAGEIFSFWKQVGRATPRRGFTSGRLLREGCLMPAVGGGLCALSNTLYEAAMNAGLEVVERHAHSRRIPGSRAAITGLDATVAWNYVNLRFRSAQEFQIRARLTQSELVIELRGPVPQPQVASRPTTPLIQIGFGPRPLDVAAHSCGSCNQSSCRHHQPAKTRSNSRTAWLLDENWPEFQKFVSENWTKDDLILLPLDGNRRKQSRYKWDLPDGAVYHEAALWALLRSVRTRRTPAGGRQTLANLDATRTIARALASQLTPDINRLVVAQSMLPFLMENGDLGGREITVLTTRLPFRELHSRLDAADAHYGNLESLHDFRAPSLWVEAESWAWEMAHEIVTPHVEVARLAGKNARLLDWLLPSSSAYAPDATASAIAFFGPAMARRGALEVRQVARELGLKVYLDSEISEGADFWSGIPHENLGKQNHMWPSDLMAVVAPSWLEGRPQKALLASHASVPIIASPACGLGNLADISIAPGDAEALKTALTNLQSQRQERILNPVLAI